MVRETTSYTDSWFNGRASNLSPPEYRLYQQCNFIMMTIYDHVNKVGIPLSEVCFLWLCFFIHRILHGEGVLIHVNYGRLSRSTCGIHVIHMALGWGSGKLVAYCTDIWASLKCRSTIEASSVRTWSLCLVRSLSSKNCVLFAGFERPDWCSRFKADLQTQTFESALLKCLACNVSSLRSISKINKRYHNTIWATKMCNKLIFALCFMYDFYLSSFPYNIKAFLFSSCP
jgi:hypothetical protein